MVGGFVEDEHIGLVDEYLGKGHSLDLSPTQFARLLIVIVDLEFRKYLLCTEFGLFFRFVGLLSLDSHCLHDGGILGEGRCLLEIAYLDVVAEYDPTFIVAFLSCKNGEQRGLAGSVLGYQADMLSFVDRERDILEEHSVAYALAERLHVHVWGYCWHGGIEILCEVKKKDGNDKGKEGKSDETRYQL